MKKLFSIKRKLILFLLSIVLTVLMGLLVGIILVFQKGFPQIKNLEDIKPVIMTTIFDDQNVLIREFAIEKRKIVKSTDIPDVLKNSIIASEDNQFHSHWGINFRGVIRAILGVIFRNKSAGGGSSITQQLARGLFLTPEATYSRKLREMLLAVQIEKKYSKEQILSYYCNKIFLGGSVYGVEAASRYYFGKPVKDINLADASLLTALMPTPNLLFDIFNKPEQNPKKKDYILRKRNFILKKMLKLNFIDKKEYNEAVKIKLPEKSFESNKESVGDYFLEEVRKYIEAKFGDNLLYKGGLRVYTSLNTEMQKWAEDSLKEGLRQLDKRRGWRTRDKLSNLLENNLDIKKYKIPSWKNLEIKLEKIVKGIVLNVNRKRAIVRIDEYTGKLSSKDALWTKMGLKSVLKKGDVAFFRVKKIDNEKKELYLSLEQEPDVQGAVLVVDNKTGQIKAMVGGYSFRDSKWNNATQALRQTGSTFKPIIYTAALENGYTPATIIKDEPFSYFDKWTNEIWEPQNHDGHFKGLITFRRALEQSRNVVTARIVEQIGPQRVVEYARKFGVTSRLKPFMSISLGVFEVTLKEMVAAYTIFPNYGVRVNPYYITEVRDQNSNIIDENYPEKKQAVDKNIAYIMNCLLQGVVKYGTGWRARYLEAPIGGKTGTTDDYTNAWFIGFSPSVTVGVWIGFDITKSLGNEETGSRAAAPVFVSFMEKYLNKYKASQQFRKPSGVIMVDIDKITGKLLTPDCMYPFKEAFVTGTEPLEFCSEEEHLKFLDYYGTAEEDKIEEEN